MIPIEDITEQDLMKAKMKAFLKTLTAADPAISQTEIINEIKDFRQKRYAQD